MPDYNSAKDLTRTTLAVLCVCVLTVSSIWIVRPFLTALVWAATIVISTWPILLSLQAHLWGKRGLATTCLIVALLLLLVIPLGFSTAALIDHTDEIVKWVDSLKERALPTPPDWLAGIPLVGANWTAKWQQVSAAGPGGLAAQVLPYADRVLTWFASTLGSVGAMVLQFLLTVIIAAILYMNGEVAGRGIRSFAYRLAGPSGDRAAVLAANSIRGVAAGVVLTAITQVLISTAGLLIVSVPGTPLIAAAVLVLCLAQIGPALIMIPAVIWTYYARGPVSCGILLVFALVATTIDNFLRPVLIRKGADLPLILIFVGVIGGLIAWGVMGIFVGPVILAVTHVLLQEWVAEAPKLEPSAAALSAREQA